MLASAGCKPAAETALAGGDTLRLSPKIALEVLGPAREKARGGYDGSLVFRVRFNSKSILFPSEIRTAGEADLISSGRDLTGSVLVVGEHRRYRGVSLELLSMARPEIIVISSSARPAVSVLGRLSARNTGAELYRTYKDGIIQIDTDGRSIQVATGGGEP
jgi:beta-lactamase superfamily II metal-dependent hydrolase